MDSLRTSANRGAIRPFAYVALLLSCFPNASQTHTDTLRPRNSANHFPPYSARHPGLVLLTVTALGVGLGVKYQAVSMKRNELAQRMSNGNYYVSVDRSGGGI